MMIDVEVNQLVPVPTVALTQPHESDAASSLARAFPLSTPSVLRRLFVSRVKFPSRFHMQSITVTSRTRNPLPQLLFSRTEAPTPNRPEPPPEAQARFGAPADCCRARAPMTPINSFSPSYHKLDNWIEIPQRLLPKSRTRREETSLPVN